MYVKTNCHCEWERTRKHLCVDVGAGDETASSTHDGQGLTPTDPSQPVDPNNPNPPVDPNKPPGELTFEDGTF